MDTLGLFLLIPIVLACACGDCNSDDKWRHLEYIFRDKSHYLWRKRLVFIHGKKVELPLFHIVPILGVAALVDVWMRVAIIAG